MKGETNRVSDKRYKIKTAQKINRKYKDRLFRFVFRDKKDLLELYNAINGTDYHDAEELEVNTLEDVLYLGMKNDMSFLLDTSMSLYEHQTSVFCGAVPAVSGGKRIPSDRNGEKAAAAVSQVCGILQWYERGT